MKLIARILFIDQTNCAQHSHSSAAMNVKKKVNPKPSDKPTKLKASNVSGAYRKLRKSEEKVAGNFHKLRNACDVGAMGGEDLRKALARAGENPVEPFTFLTKINESFHSTKTPTVDSIEIPMLTDIDIQLETLSRRIQLNKSLLEQTSNRVKQFNSSLERLSKKTIDSENHSSLPDEEYYPSIDGMQQTLRFTIDTLGKIKDTEANGSEIVQEKLTKN